MVGFCSKCGALAPESVSACDRCGAALNQPASGGSGSDTPYEAGYIVELGPPSQPIPPVLAHEGPPAVEPASSGAPVPQADAADRCLKCKEQAPGARYLFSVTRRHSTLRRIMERSISIPLCHGGCNAE